LRAGLLAGVGTGPAAALLEFSGVVVEEFVDGRLAEALSVWMDVENDLRINRLPFRRNSDY
jgi:hypothetical protein